MKVIIVKKVSKRFSVVAICQNNNFKISVDPLLLFQIISVGKKFECYLEKDI